MENKENGNKCTKPKMLDKMFNNEGLFFRTNINKNYLYEYIISR